MKNPIDVEQTARTKLAEFIVNGSRGKMLCHADMYFRDDVESMVRMPIETADGHLIEGVFYSASRENRYYLLCLSTQVGCPCACNFCGFKEYGYVRNLTGDEILEQASIVLERARGRSEYDILGRSVKVSFVKGGDPLLNPNFEDAIERFAEALPLKLKVSTVFPAGKSAANNYGKIVRASSEYPNIVQLQVSLISTDGDYRKQQAGISLAGFREIREAGELWMENVPPRKVDLCFPVTKSTPMQPEKIKRVLPPEIFVARLRGYVETGSGKASGLETVTQNEINVIKRSFEDAGYQVLLGGPGEMESKFKLGPAEFLKFYRMIRS